MINFSNHLKAIKENQTLSVIFKTSQILFLISFLFGYKALACANFPDKIKLSGSSFESETIEVSPSPESYEGRPSPENHKIYLDQTSFLFLKMVQNKPCWILSQNKKEFNFCNRKKDLHFINDNTKEKTGIIKFEHNKRRFSIYSTNKNGKLNKTRPWLVFQETVVPGRKYSKYQLTVKAFDGNTLVGQYKSSSPTPLTRSMTNTKDEMSDLRGKKFVSYGCDLQFESF